MVFSSIEFLWLFMPLVLALYLLLPPRARNALLALVSLVFYAWGAGSLLFLMLGSIAFNYVAGRVIGWAVDANREPRAKQITAAAVVFNLAVLFFWKYAVFAVGQFNEVLGIFDTSVSVPSITLPIGISFFTFHGISYIVDIHRGTARPLRKPWEFGQYMTFFPQLIAGPIVRYHQIDDQIRTPPPRSQRLDDIAEGFPRFALGLAKKVLVADQVAVIANACFADGHPTTGSAWLGALAYTVQIYFDFSGYSDMAIGLARMFGFEFPENFNRPYSSVSITDFWRRWHMTLSRWFRDYVYFPLGGNRGDQQTTVRNLLFVFLLTGIWHGAAWTFVLWGVFHGVAIVIERLTGIRDLPDERWEYPRRAFTLLLVVLAWVLFRASGLTQAGDFYSAMLIPDTLSLPDAIRNVITTQAGLALGFGLLSVLLPRDYVTGLKMKEPWSGAPLALRLGALAILPWAAIAVAAGSFSPFLYFRF